LPVVLAHAGGFQFESIVPLAQRPNVYLDLSYTPAIMSKVGKAQSCRRFMGLVLETAPDRCMFGSDFPEMDVGHSLEIVQGLLDDWGCDPDEKGRVMGGTAERLYFGDGP
jgi:predicted TIM-barrel fold metal-dependent hydrolase